jgi:hypothetical protein
MAENKTKQSDDSVAAFIASITDPDTRADCEKLVKMMQAASGAAPKMWGKTIVGFGDHHYKYASGREGDWFKLGFSPRKANLTLYAGIGGGWHPALLQKLGKHSTGSGCLYVRSLSAIDVTVLAALFKDVIKSGKMLADANAVKDKAAKDAKAKGKPLAKAEKVAVRNPNAPGHVANVDAAHYNAMKKALLKVLPRKSPGLNQTDMMAAVLPHLPDDLFPGGATAGWWTKCVQLDLEAQGVVVREKTKPLRWHRA